MTGLNMAILQNEWHNPALDGAVLCNFLEKTGRAARNGGKGLVGTECNGVKSYRSARNGDNQEGMGRAAKYTAKLCVSRTISAGRWMRYVLVMLLLLLRKSMAQSMHSSALLG